MPGKSILIVEDEESIRASLAELFEGDAIDVLTAASLADARRHLEGRSVDLVVTDLRLGTQRDGGLQVVAIAGLLAADAPVVVLTAYPEASNRLAAGRLGATHFLQKPVDLDVIARIAAAHGITSSLMAGRMPATD